MPLSLHSLFPFPLLHIHIFPYSQFPIIPYSLYFPFFEICRFSGQSNGNCGGGGVKHFLSLTESLYFCYKRAHTKFQNPMICTSGLDLKFGRFPVKIGLKFRQRQGGSSLPCLRTRRDPPLSPPRHQRNFSGTRVCRVAFKHLPQPLRSRIQRFRTLGQVFLGKI